MNKFIKKMGISFVFMGALFSSPVTLAQTSNAKVQTKVVSNQNLGISIKQFKSNFNKLADQLGVPSITEITFEDEDDGESFSIQMPENLAIVGNVNKQGILTRLSVGLDAANLPKNSLINAMSMLGGFAITAMKAVDNNKNDEKRDDAVQDVFEALLSDKKTLTAKNTKYKKYGRFNFAAYSHPKLGLVMIGVEANK